MERLTRWVPTTVHGRTVAQTAEPTCDAKIADVIRRLAEYENLGMTPEEIKRFFANVRALLRTQRAAAALCEDRLFRNALKEMTDDLLLLFDLAIAKGVIND